MKVKQIMTKDVITIPHNVTLLKAAKVLSENNLSGAPVVDDEGDIVGIVSEKDIFKAMYPSHSEFYESPGVWVDLDKLEERTKESVDKPVQDFMTREVVTVNKEASLMQVGSMMLVRGIHRVVVVDQENKLIGIVTRKGIYQNILKSQLGV